LRGWNSGASRPNPLMARVVKARTLSGDENLEFSSGVFSGRSAGLTVFAASARFMVLGCNSGCRIKASRRGLRQTH
jgi:hypothetical protein